MFFRNRKKNKSFRKNEIAPEDIFIDSTNLSGFDEDGFEGRLERPISILSLRSLIVFFVFLSLIFGFRLYVLQVKEGKVYADWSSDNRLRSEIVFANRGVIEDRFGNPLAWNESATSTGDPFTLRRYISEEGFAHVLGYVSAPKKDSSGVYYETKYKGVAGIEAYYDDVLSGENGEVLIEENARLEEQSKSVLIPEKHGQNIKLSIDARLQSALFGSIKDLAEQAGFTGGAGLVMNVNNGEVLALTSFPEYDPQVMSDGSDQDKINNYLRDKNNVFLNRAVSGLYTPGSTVKPFVALGALNENLISPSKDLLSTGALIVPNPFFPDQPSVFRDWRAHGWVNMVEAIAQSSNEYFFKIGGGFETQQGLGIRKIREYTSSFGLDSVTNVDLFGEERGVIPSPEWKQEVFNDEWRVGDTYNTSIGQYGFQITPIELARAVAVIANGGNLIKPRIRMSASESSETIDFLDESELKVVREGMKGGVDYGTANAVNVGYVEIAAKTGTAELGSAKSRVNSWITGFFPYEDPAYVFSIVMEEASIANTLGASRAARSFFDRVYLTAPEYFE